MQGYCACPHAQIRAYPRLGVRSTQGLADRLRTGGLLVAAGIIEDQEEEVRGALQAHGMAVVEQRQEKDWVTLVAARRPSDLEP